RLAEESGAAIVVVAHLNKGQSNDPLQRLGGSVGLAAAARSVVLLGRDPDDPQGTSGSRRVLAHAKSNLGSLDDSLGFAIETIELESGVTTARIVETGLSAYSAPDLLEVRSFPGGAKFTAASDLLVAQLRDGPRTAKELGDIATAGGISSQTLRRAKVALN